MIASRTELNLEQLWVATTDDRGWFEFANVPPGTYRLVAESWSGTEGFLAFGAQRRPSAYLILHGVAENVTVEAGKKSTAWVRQLGQRGALQFGIPAHGCGNYPTIFQFHMKIPLIEMNSLTF